MPLAVGLAWSPSREPFQESVLGYSLAEPDSIKNEKRKFRDDEYEILLKDFSVKESRKNCHVIGR